MLAEEKLYLSSIGVEDLDVCLAEDSTGLLKKSFILRLTYKLEERVRDSDFDLFLSQVMTQTTVGNKPNFPSFKS